MYFIQEPKTVSPMNLYTGKGGVYEWVNHSEFKEGYGTSLEAKQAFLEYHNVKPKESNWDKEHTNFVFRRFTATLISGTPAFARIKRIKNEYCK